MGGCRTGWRRSILREDPGTSTQESTARLVEHLVVLAEPEWVRIKGSDAPVRTRGLVGIEPRDGLVGRAEAGLVGRRWEMAALAVPCRRLRTPRLPSSSLPPI